MLLLFFTVPADALPPTEPNYGPWTVIPEIVSFWTRITR